MLLYLWFFLYVFVVVVVNHVAAVSCGDDVYEDDPKVRGDFPEDFSMANAVVCVCIFVPKILFECVGVRKSVTSPHEIECFPLLSEDFPVWMY